ncbi:hypothetical protein CROQUDRAFT_38047 [Cronartium quercuum f. sp. fusiforme G11]|uniref:Integrase core domain-containing protein n=1 Tax=Cronartium quercuum f. sp. fusiforme G11 TaxID=708437 RepID=A0A9P6TG21_9BASI|nr:hypothetical protein CROQUDRAFT_38047 [Cronartium quercuum f. sp. fusiforme G11]
MGEIKRCHTLGLQKKEVVPHIRRICDVPEFTENRLKTLCKEMGLNWRKDDIDLGLGTSEEVLHKMEFEIKGSRSTAGIRSMQKGFAVDHHLKVSRSTVASMMRKLYPEGLEKRQRRKLHHRLYDVPGPNFVWAMDVHDKLKPFGICIYGTIDAWSRKVLKLHVATNNHDLRRIGVQFLRTVEQMGVCPQKVITDNSTTKTDDDIVTFQITFLHLIGELDWAEAEKRYQFNTTFQHHHHHHQTIEQVWGQLMFEKILMIRDSILCAIFKEIYDPSNPLHKAVFLHLFIHLIQRILDSSILEYNFNQIPKSKCPTVLTGVAPEVCYDAPKNYKGTEGGIEVPKEVVKNMIAQYYPDEDRLFQITPPIFANKISNIIVQLGIIESEICLNNVWSIFKQVIERFESIDVQGLNEFPVVGILKSDGEFEEYDRLKNRFVL